MSENSKIEWTDHTFNPWEGCQKVGLGCDHCYAETRNARFGGGVAVNWGPGAPRRRTSVSNWRKPLAWNMQNFVQCEACGHRGPGVPWRDVGPNMGIVDDGHQCGKCASRSVEPTRARVFCASLADVFDNAVDPKWRRDLFDLIRATQNIDWLLLTKRIGNAQFLFDECHMDPPDGGSGYDWPTNVWLGATIVNQLEADRDIPKLLAVPAARRFLSMEPLLGPVSFEGIFASANMHDGTNALEALDWVIVGGESGPGARPMHPDWARDLRDQCAAAGVPFLFKQWGEWAPGECAAHTLSMRSVLTADLFGGKWTINKIPGNTEFHVDDEPPLYWAGKKAAGRLLDGVQHDGYPEAP